MPRHGYVLLSAALLILPPAEDSSAVARRGPTCLGKSPTIVGTRGPDRLMGTMKSDVIVGLRGNDVIRGVGGNDRVCGGRGNDRLYGGPGGDALSGNVGNDSLFGETGNDRLIGGRGVDGCLQSGGAGSKESCAIVVAAAGDIACEPGEERTRSSCHHKATSDLLLALGLVAVLPLGDTQYEDGALQKFREAYHPTWGRVKDMTYPAVGNHEYLTEDAHGYFRYFGTVAGRPSQGYYSYDLDGWHVVVLNSTCGGAGGCDAGSDQERWLRADLAAHRVDCTLAYWHAPRFSSGVHGSNPDYGAFWEALYEAGADVVLNGHDHIYERFGPQNPREQADAARGIRQFIAGTGGKNLTGTGTPRPNSQLRHSDTFGVLRLTLREGGHDWRFVPEAGKAFTDFGSDACHS
jgi:hypothetical protein